MDCEHCDRPVKARGLCDTHYRAVLRAERKMSPAAARRERDEALTKARSARRDRAQERLDELAFLLDTGEWPPRACKRLGWTVPGAVIAAKRAGRGDITAVLWRHEREAAS